MRSGTSNAGTDSAYAARIAATGETSPDPPTAPRTERREARPAASTPVDGAATASASSAPAALAPEPIDVQFVDLEGDPVPGVVVAWPMGPAGLPPLDAGLRAGSIEVGESAPLPASPESSAAMETATTDAAGLASLPRSALDALRTTESSWVVLTHGAEAGSDRQVVVLAPAVDLAGVCIAPDGTPVGRAMVEMAAQVEAIPGFSIQLGSTGAMRTWRTAADDQGRFSLDRAPTHPVFELKASRFRETNQVSVAVPATSDRSMRVVLRESSTESRRPFVHGRVFASDGRTVEGATVSFGSAHDVTDALGAYRIEVKYWPRDCPVVASDSEGRFERGPLPDESEARSHRGAGPFDLTLPAAMPRLVGTVVDPEGQPIEGLEVLLIDATRAGGSSRMFERARGDCSLGIAAETDARGGFEFPRVAERPYDLRVLDPDEHVSHDVLGVDPTSGPVEIAFPGRDAAPPLRGRIVDVHGAPAVGVEVSVWIARFYTPGGGSSSTVGSTVATDVEGRFEIEHAARAGARVQVRQPEDPSGQSLLSLDTADLGPSVELEVDLRCEVLLNGDGRPDVDSVVFLDREGEATETWTIRSGVLSFDRGSVRRLPSGAFPLVMIPQRAVTIELRTEGAEPERRPVHLDPYRPNEIDL